MAYRRCGSRDDLSDAWPFFRREAALRRGRGAPCAARTQASRSDSMTARRARALAAVWTVPSGVFVILVHLVIAHYRIETPPRLSDDARTAIMTRLRAAFVGADATLADLP